MLRNLFTPGILKNKINEEWTYEYTANIKMTFNPMVLSKYEKTYKSVFGVNPKYYGALNDDDIFIPYYPKKIYEVILNNWTRILNEYSTTKLLHQLAIECNNILFNSRHENNEKLVNYFINVNTNVFGSDATKNLIMIYDFDRYEYRYEYPSKLRGYEPYLKFEYNKCDYTLDRDEDIFNEYFEKFSTITYYNFFVRKHRVLLPTEEDIKKFKHPKEIEEFILLKNFSLEEAKYIDDTFVLFPLYKAIYNPIYTRYFITHSTKTNKKILLKVCCATSELVVFDTNEENKILYNEPDFEYVYCMFHPNEVEKFKNKGFGFVLDENDEECILFITEYLHSKKGEAYRKYLKNVKFIERPNIETIKELGLDENTNLIEIHFDRPPQSSKARQSCALTLYVLSVLAKAIGNFLLGLLKIILSFFGLY